MELYEYEALTFVDLALVDTKVSTVSNLVNHSLDDAQGS